MSVLATVPFAATPDESDVFYVHEDLTGDATGGTASFSCKFPTPKTIVSLLVVAQARGSTLYAEISLLNLPEAAAYFRLPPVASVANGSVTNTSQGQVHLIIAGDAARAIPSIRSATYLFVSFYNANATLYTLHAICRLADAGPRKSATGQRLAGRPGLPSAIGGAGISPAPPVFSRKGIIRGTTGGILQRRALRPFR